MMKDNYLRFEDLMELVGVLNNLEHYEGILLAEVGRITAVIPVDMEDKLRPFLGQKIGILKIDGKYLHRVLSTDIESSLNQTTIAGRTLTEEICN